MTDFDPLAGGESSEFDVDFNGVGDWGGDFAPFESGTYTYIIMEAKPEKSSKGNPMIELGLMVSGDHHANLAGKRVRDWLTLTKDAMPRVKQAYGAIMDIPKELLDTTILRAGWWNDLIGRLVKGVTVQDPWQTQDQLTGQMKTGVSMKITGYIPADKENSAMTSPQTAGGLSI